MNLPVAVMVSLVALPRTTPPLKVAPPSTVRLPVTPAFSSTVSVPSMLVLPVLDATVNLSVVPDLTAKFASTSTVLLNSLVPVTVRLPIIPAFASTSSVSMCAVHQGINFSILVY